MIISETTSLEDLDFDYEQPCEHTTCHSKYGFTTSAMFLVYRYPCFKCGRPEGQGFMCLPCWEAMADGCLCPICRNPSERDDRLNILRVIGTR